MVKDIHQEIRAGFKGLGDVEMFKIVYISPEILREISRKKQRELESKIMIIEKRKNDHRK
jgi:hypothetical protein